MSPRFDRISARARRAAVRLASRASAFWTASSAAAMRSSRASTRAWEACADGVLGIDLAQLGQLPARLLGLSSWSRVSPDGRAGRLPKPGSMASAARKLAIASSKSPAVDLEEPQVVVGLGQVLVHRQGRPELLLGRRLVAAGEGHQPQTAARLGHPRIVFQGQGEQPRRPVELPPGVGPGAFRLVLDGLGVGVGLGRGAGERPANSRARSSARRPAALGRISR